MLFDKGPVEKPSPQEAAQRSVGKPRLRVPQRRQVEMHWASLDELLEAEHPARIIWAAVCGLDLSRWLEQINAVEGHVGRNATDPRLLVALWVYATLEGIGSARQIAGLCQKHVAYQWLCGGVTVNYHMLADFRSQNGPAWDNLLTQIVATLLAEDLVTMQRVAQDGMRVRASAGKSSFRRKGRLQQCLQAARQQVETLKKLADEDPHELTQRQRAARERAAGERDRRLRQALQQCEQLEQQREEQAPKSGRSPQQARASTTDPQARVIKFADGGYRPGYNVQYATDVPSGIIVGVEVTNAGSDSEQLPPMLEQIHTRSGKTPREALVDGGFTSLEAIRKAAEQDCLVYGPLKDEQKQLAAGKDPYAKKKGDSEAVAQWRQRMGTALGKAIYKLRCQSAEWVNALARNRGFQQMPVRGQPKCRIVATLYAITHNLIQGRRLRALAEATAN